MDWANIKKKKGYEIVDMEPKCFEGEVENVIDTIEEESNHLLTFEHLYCTCYFVYLSLRLFDYN
jgi:hypothetical protein